MLEYDLLQEVTEPSQPIDLRLSHAQMPIFFGSLLRSHPSSKGLNLGEKTSPLFQLVLKFCLCVCFFYGSQLTGKKSSSRGGSRGSVQGVRLGGGGGGGGGGVWAGGAHPPPPPKITCGFLIQLVFCKKKNILFIGVEVEQATSAPPPKKKNLDPPLSSGHKLLQTKILWPTNKSA